MKKSDKSLVSVCALVGAVLLLVSIILQFIPFWSAGGDTASVAGYIWFPSGHEALTEAITNQVEGFDLNQIVLAPAVQLICGVIGFVLCFVKKDTLAPFVLTGLSGLFGVYGCLDSVFRMGSFWTAFLVVDVLLALVTIIGIGLWLNNRKNEPQHVAYV